MTRNKNRNQNDLSAAQKRIKIQTKLTLILRAQLTNRRINTINKQKTQPRPMKVNQYLNKKS